jgi:hypothetical protein
MNSFVRPQLLMPGANAVRHKIRIVAHREVIAFRNYDLLSFWKQLLPSRPKSKRIIAFTEYRQYR